MHFKGSAGPRAAPTESLYYICYFRYDSKGILCKTWPKSTVTLMRRVIVIELVLLYCSVHWCTVHTRSVMLGCQPFFYDFGCQPLLYTCLLVYCAIHWCTNYARSVMFNCQPWSVYWWTVHAGSIILHACVMSVPVQPLFSKSIKKMNFNFVTGQGQKL